MFSSTPDGYVDVSVRIILGVPVVRSNLTEKSMYELKSGIFIFLKN
jgi:hypothetical protein